MFQLKSAHDIKENELKFVNEELIECVSQTLSSADVSKDKIEATKVALSDFVKNNEKYLLISITNIILEICTGKEINSLFSKDGEALEESTNTLFEQVKRDIRNSLLDPTKKERPFTIAEYSAETTFDKVHAIPIEVVAKFHSRFVANCKKYGYKRRDEYGHLVLNQKSEDFTEAELLDPEIRNKLKSIMNDKVVPFIHDGGGLASMQIGLSTRLFGIHAPNKSTEEETKYYSSVLQASHSKGMNPNNYSVDHFINEGYKTATDEIMFVINPKIVKTSDDCIVEWWEGCFSFPKFRTLLKRPVACEMHYIDHNFQPVQVKLFGWLAEAAIHETDHLNGTNLIDTVDPYKLKSHISGWAPGGRYNKL